MPLAGKSFGAGMSLGIIGIGYVGLVSAVCFAEAGFDVVAVDRDAEKISSLVQGKIPIFEEGLPELLAKHTQSGRLRFSAGIGEAVRESRIIFLCVGTPSRNDGNADMSQVESVVKDIVNTADGYRLLVVKSTVPVGTARWVRRVVNLYAKNRQVEIEVASNPEFLREGIAVRDFLYPDRIVIGAESERARQALLELYQGFDCPKLVTNLATAETIKYAANTFLATKISFINLLADFCEAVGADVELVARGMGLDQRIGKEFLKAGAGFGGSCLPKDLRAFICSAREHQVDSKLLESVLEINNSRPERLIGLLQKALWVIRGKQIAVLGLAFKPGTDDVRDTPAAKVIEKLKEEGAFIRAFDPVAVDNFQAAYPEISKDVAFYNRPEPCIQDSHAMVVITAWPQIVQLDLAVVKESMNFPIIIDGRNIFQGDAVKELGFKYYPTGKPPAND